MAYNLHAIEQMQLRRQPRDDGVGRLKFDFHTGRARPGEGRGRVRSYRRGRRAPRGLPADPRGRPRGGPEAAAALDRPDLGLGRRAEGDASGQGRLLRHGRPRHQARRGDAHDEEGHGRRGARAGPGGYGHGRAAAGALAGPRAGRRERHLRRRVPACVEINQCVGCTRQFFTKSFLGDDAAVLARSRGEEPASPRHRAGVASMAWRTMRRFSTNAP